MCAFRCASRKAISRNLGETFNRMTQELRTQRDDIMRARDVIDSRRRFTEAVLAGASAGVIGVDGNGCVSILNRSAEKLIGRSEAECARQAAGRSVARTRRHHGRRRAPARARQDQVTISRNGRERNLSVRVTSEQSADSDHGYVVTLDDITELVAAQRTSAWADVARRIAHEIKNPLTPIQLSAERLRRKYGKVIVDDRERVRAVHRHHRAPGRRHQAHGRRVLALRAHAEAGDGRRRRRRHRAADGVPDAGRQCRHRYRRRDRRRPDAGAFRPPADLAGLTNVIKNATEAIAAVPPAELGKGTIRVFAAREGDDIVIDVVDNGIGLPKENRSRLLEPYVTTREKGTGLGLAIVGRIVEEHGGQIELRDAAEKIPGPARRAGCASASRRPARRRLPNPNSTKSVNE